MDVQDLGIAEAAEQRAPQRRGIGAAALGKMQCLGDSHHGAADDDLIGELGHLARADRSDAGGATEGRKDRREVLDRVLGTAGQMASVPSRAPTSPPDTGASTYRMPLASRYFAWARHVSTGMELITTKLESGRRASAGTAPAWSGLKSTASTTSPVLSMTMATSHSAIAAAGVSAIATPAWQERQLLRASCSTPTP